MGNLKSVTVVKRDFLTGRFLKTIMPSKDTLEKLYSKEGETPFRISQKYHVCCATVYYWLRQYHIPLKRPYLSYVKMNMTSVEKAYFAGYLDGDGTITIGLTTNKHNRKGLSTHIEVSLITKHEAFALKLKKMIGGNLQSFVYHDSREKKNGYKVSFGNQRSALAFLEQIWPFLILKQQQAKLMITYLQQRLHDRRKGKGNAAIISEDSWKIISEIRRLNYGNKGYNQQKHKI